MRRVEGNADVKLLECTNPVQNKWRVRWDVQVADGSTTFMEEEFKGKPDVDTVRSLIYGWINDRVDEKILSGLTFLGNKVWLSRENQFNYKSIYDLAVQTGGKNLPVKFKFGTDEQPYYVDFNTLEDLSFFTQKWLTHIKTTVENGWKEKDLVDFTLYI